MTSCRLNNLFLMYVHQDLTDSLDICKIARDFVSVNSRRKHYFGNLILWVFTCPQAHVIHFITF